LGAEGPEDRRGKGGHVARDSANPTRLHENPATLRPRAEGVKANAEGTFLNIGRSRHPMLLREGYYFWRVLGQRHLSRARMGALQFRFLQRVVRHAYAHHPFYRRWYDRKGFQPRDLASLEDVARIPPVSKEVLQRHSAVFGGTAPHVRLATSGTTGPPLRVLLDEEAADYLNCVFTRSLMECGYNPLRRLGFVWYRKEENSSVRRLGLCRKVVISPDWPQERQLSELAQHRPSYLYCFPFMLYRLARANPDAMRELRLKGAFCAGEPLTGRMALELERMLGCPVSDMYAMTEFNILAYRASARAYTVNSDSVFMELLPAGDDLKAVTATSLCNTLTPLIRYETGDLVRTQGDNITEVLGRRELLIPTDDGAVAVGRLIDALVERADVGLFRFVLHGKQLIVETDQNAQAPRADGRMLRDVRAVVPGLEVSVRRNARLSFLPRGKLRILERK